MGRDGKQFGLPKDWDTVGIFYNKDLLARAGLKESDLQNLTWNPNNGGTWQSTIVKLTTDKSGENGLAAGFDKKNVERTATKPAKAQASTDRPSGPSFYGATTGWKYNDGLYAKKYDDDDPRFAQAIQWLADLNLKYGLIPSFQDVQSGPDSLFRAGKVPMVTNGSWMVDDYTGRLPSRWALLRSPKASTASA